MKLTKMLFSSGALATGRVRHYSEWELPAPVTRSRFDDSLVLRQAARRRAAWLDTGRDRPRRVSVLGLVARFVRR